MSLDGFDSNDEVLAMVSRRIWSAGETVGNTSSSSISPQTEPAPIFMSILRLSE
jgi:hypothetical protein